MFLLSHSYQMLHYELLCNQDFACHILIQVFLIVQIMAIFRIICLLLRTNSTYHRLKSFLQTPLKINGTFPLSSFNTYPISRFLSSSKIQISWRPFLISQNCPFFANDQQLMKEEVLSIAISQLIGFSNLYQIYSYTLIYRKMKVTTPIFTILTILSSCKLKLSLSFCFCNLMNNLRKTF